MGWNIPRPLEHEPIKKISYLLWGLSFLLLVLISFIVTLFIYDGDDSLLFCFFAFILPMILWFIALAIKVSNLYSDDVYNNEITKQNLESTKLWQNWSKTQLPIFASHVICAEPNGVQALTGELTKIPLYPLKARPLFNATASTKSFWFLDEVKQNLEQQCPYYRKYLSHIYIPNALMEDEDLLNAIFNRWDLRAEPIMDYNIWISELYQHIDDIELSLILTCQYSDTNYRNHSKFISALLIGGTSLIDSQIQTAQSWLGRLMISEHDLSADLQQLFTYTQFSPENINDIWLSGLNKNHRIQLALATNQLAMGEDNQQLLHDIDMTFAKPSKLTQYFTLTLASERVRTHLRDQLTLIEYQGTVYLQLITHQKLVS
ncbi:hypothetical protein J3U21_03910 [Gilliamella sp. B2776]|uniref:hypothetical protein n=1 Tax=unclassified Gilliamella TaxID=2685620 RepID=UPI00226A93EE|nr:MULTISPECIES: hypothetical protein [unclassified Gilliamella]MCX8649214.1 hypothetical protein [Gilliamella sp. B2779]MCX8655172.1 hypothetical protein [Gilliamella sp. B2737]MCX8691291.1 hypothetical protein [Gilliamella sp. B2776]MCX8702184.1 hypothetical protein [Gilliamella sp. B2781]WDM19286.1 hypothetical protein J4T76_02755 [Gilliamella sp. B3022]